MIRLASETCVAESGDAEGTLVVDPVEPEVELAAPAGPEMNVVLEEISRQLAGHERDLEDASDGGEVLVEGEYLLAAQVEQILIGQGDIRPRHRRGAASPSVVGRLYQHHN